MVHPGIEKRWINEKIGYGLVAIQTIPKGTIVVVDEGRRITVAEYLSYTLIKKRATYQIDENTFLAPDNFESPNKELVVNHSCRPNMRHTGEGRWETVRTIKVGEEITCDYVVFQTNQYGDFDSYKCCCGSVRCRGRLSGDDWKERELQERYRGQFFPSVQRLIDQGGY
jgi:uncharacterized protein